MDILDKVKNIKIADFDYPLPDERIARHPLAARDSCLLIVAGNRGAVSHCRFDALPQLLPQDSLLVCNNTRVINARIRFRKETGSEVEVFLLEPLDPEDYVLMFQSRGRCGWSCMVGNLKRWKSGALTKELYVDGRKVTLTALRGEARPGNAHVVEFSWDALDLTFASIVDAAGYIPIPPYLRRQSEQSDADDYQTVYARVKGSVVAPTAGLHFTPRLFDALKGKGIAPMPVTLHVGAGTFQPVKSDLIGDHPMHTEVFTVDRSLVEALVDALRGGSPVTAVGTTSVRTLESLPYLGMAVADGDCSLSVGQWTAYMADSPESDEDLKRQTIYWLDALLGYFDRNSLSTLTASTSIMIAPGFRWRIVDRMVTNFHQPQSTLLLLVSSFLGADNSGLPRWRGIYEEALAGDYRFLSYGDACLFERGNRVAMPD